MNPNQDINPNADEIKNLEAQIAGIDIKNLDPNDNGKVLSPVVETKQPEVKTETKEETVVETKVEETSDPVKTELERIKGQTQGKTQKEKFEYKLQRELAQAKEMGIDIAGLAGITPKEEEIAEDKPLTRKDIEELLKSSSPKPKSATEMALEIENEAERELHLYYLDNKVRPSGDPEEDFKTAKTMVNAIKLQNQIKLAEIKPTASNHSTASSVQPMKDNNFDNVKLTPDEEYLLKDASVRGIAITREEIIKMRG
jgi:hypothetical protein